MRSWLRERPLALLALLVFEYLLVWATEANFAAWLCLNVLALLCAWELKRVLRAREQQRNA